MRLFSDTDDETGLGGALATLSRQRYLDGHPGAAEVDARRAVRLLEGQGAGDVLALARLYLDALLLLTDREREALDDLDGLLELGERLGQRASSPSGTPTAGSPGPGSVTRAGGPTCC